MPLAVVDAAGRGRPEFYATLGNGSMPVEVLSPRMSPRGTFQPRRAMSASLIGHSGSSAVRLSTASLRNRHQGPFHHGIRGRGGTIYRAALPSDHLESRYACHRSRQIRWAGQPGLQGHSRPEPKAGHVIQIKAFGINQPALTIDDLPEPLPRTRSGTPCRLPAVSGRRRCRMHGGAPGSGGPKGSHNGNYKHGRYTAEAIASRRWLRQCIRDVMALTKRLRQP
jgi:glucans biosynthesis protein